MIENLQLLEYIGKTKTQKLIDEIHSEYKERFVKSFPDYNYLTKSASIVTITNEKEITGIGMSKMNDLLVDNWLKFIGLILTGSGDDSIRATPSLGATNFVPDNAVNRFNGTDNTPSPSNIGGQIQTGSGTGTLARSRTSLFTPVQTFSMAGIAGYNSGLGKIDIPTTGVSGSTYSISETGLFLIFFMTSPNATSAFCLMSHDEINPVVPVSVGQTVNLDYALLLS